MVKEGPQQAAQMVQAAKKAAEGFKSGDPQCAAEALLEARAQGCTSFHPMGVDLKVLWESFSRFLLVYEGRSTGS